MEDDKAQRVRRILKTHLRNEVVLDALAGHRPDPKGALISLLASDLPIFPETRAAIVAVLERDRETPGIRLQFHGHTRVPGAARMLADTKIKWLQDAKRQVESGLTKEAFLAADPAPDPRDRLHPDQTTYLDIALRLYKRYLTWRQSPEQLARRQYCTDDEQWERATAATFALEEARREFASKPARSRRREKGTDD